MRLTPATAALLDADPDAGGLGDIWSKIGDFGLTYGGAIAGGVATGNYAAALDQAAKIRAAENARKAELERLKIQAAQPSLLDTIGLTVPATSTGTTAAGTTAAAPAPAASRVNPNALLIGGGVAALVLLVVVAKK